MEHKAINETQVLVTAKKEYPTEASVWDFININSLYSKGKKRMLIVGDSITAGVYNVIGEVASPFWVVDAYTTSLPINDKDYLPALKNALKQSRLPYDVIHFNNGGHGLETEEEYEESYREVIALIRELHPQAKIVLATCIQACVPEKDGTFQKPLTSWHRWTDPRDNICRRLCKEYDLRLNDLAEYSKKIKNNHVPDGVHYTDEGSKKLAFQFVKFAR